MCNQTIKQEYLLTSKRSQKFEDEMTTALLYTRRLQTAMLHYDRRGAIPALKKRRYNKELQVDESCMVGCGVELNLTLPDCAAARICNEHSTIDIDDYSLVCLKYLIIYLNIQLLTYFLPLLNFVFSSKSTLLIISKT